jgi:hypothetical protein
MSDGITIPEDITYLTPFPMIFHSRHGINIS